MSLNNLIKKSWALNFTLGSLNLIIYNVYSNNLPFKYYISFLWGLRPCLFCSLFLFYLKKWVFTCKVRGFLDYLPRLLLNNNNSPPFKSCAIFWWPPLIPMKGLRISVMFQFHPRPASGLLDMNHLTVASLSN